MISIILIYRYIDSKYPKNYFLQFFGASVITAVVDSILFYSENFYSEVNYAELMIGNIAEKIMVCIILSILFAFYFLVNPQKESKRKELKDIFTIIDFTSGKR
jgi:hypothetical protein